MPSKLPEDTDQAATWDAIVRGRYPDPFSVLGPHRDGLSWRVTCFQPQAQAVTLVGRDGGALTSMEKRHAGGLFVGRLPEGQADYVLRLDQSGQRCDIEDPYRFASLLGDLDMHLIGEGTHQRLYDKLGAHLAETSGVTGVHFALWAPNASRVSVVGAFNDWDGRVHVMRFHPSIGVWDIFVPGLAAGTLYKYELLDSAGRLLPLKSDPFAQRAEAPPGNASIVFESNYEWGDDAWMSGRGDTIGLNRPQSIYEVHLGSWRRRLQEQNRWLTYAELADELVTYVRDLGFTHIELLPITEHPFDASWGYQPIGLFAATWRFGDPDGLRYFVDRCHQAGIAVIFDWVAAHFPRDPNGLGHFDGTALYEHEDPRRGAHADWGTLIFNYGRSEVRNYLISNALFWVDEFHFDGLRVDAVASLLYLDYSREAGEWVANEHGGNENLEAIAFLRDLNVAVHQRGAVTTAEESTAWPGVSHPTETGGLGFSFKWNMGWMHDTLSYVGEDPVHRKHHHDRMTFGLIYAFHENFVLPLSHDEVVHGKGSILARMPGDEWQKFANLRAYLGFMYGHPGKKLLFMGTEFAQHREWNHDRSLDWDLCTQPLHAGVQRWVGDLNRLYSATPALYDMDFDAAGFQWLNWDDRDNSVYSWIRRSGDGHHMIMITNFTPVVRHGYQLGVPGAHVYTEVLNSDAADYGGSGAGNLGRVVCEHGAYRGQPSSLTLTLPPLATIVLQPVSLEAAV